MKIATILFVYNRPKYLKRCLSSINFPIDYAFVDWSNKQGKIRNILFDDKRIKNIIGRETHYGLAGNIISGVSEVFDRGYDAVIVIEDDLILSPIYYKYMRDSLIFNMSIKEVGSISGHKINDDYRMFLSLGWGTWKDRWDEVSWNFEEVDEGFNDLYPDYVRIYNNARSGKIDSWAIRFAYWHYKNNKKCLHPGSPLVKHIGRNGTHTKWYPGIRPLIRRIGANLNFR